MKSGFVVALVGMLASGPAAAEDAASSFPSVLCERHVSPAEPAQTFITLLDAGRITFAPAASHSRNTGHPLGGTQASAAAKGTARGGQGK